MIFRLLAGFNPIALVASVLVVTGLGYGVIHYIQNTGELRQQIEVLERELEKRERIDEAVRTAPTDRDDALGVLRDFLTDP